MARGIKRALDAAAAAANPVRRAPGARWTGPVISTPRRREPQRAASSSRSPPRCGRRPGGRLAAIAALDICRPGDLYLSALRVATDLQNQGYGSRFLRQPLGIAARPGHRPVRRQQRPGASQGGTDGRTEKP